MDKWKLFPFCSKNVKIISNKVLFHSWRMGWVYITVQFDLVLKMHLIFWTDFFFFKRTEPLACQYLDSSFNLFSDNVTQWKKPVSPASLLSFHSTSLYRFVWFKVDGTLHSQIHAHSSLMCHLFHQWLMCPLWLVLCWVYKWMFQRNLFCIC